MELSNSSVGAAVIPKSQSPLQRLLGVFVSPRETFEDVAVRPNFWIPVIAMVVVYVVTGFFTIDLDLRHGLKIIRDMPMMKEEMIAKAEEGIEAEMNSPWRFSRLVTTVAFIGFSWIVVSSISLLVGNVILGGEAKFKTIFSITAWAYLITLVERIVKTILGLAKDSKEVVTSLAVFKPLDEAKTLGFNLLNRFDVFTIWYLMVYIIGISAVYKFSAGKSTAMVVSLWLLGSAIFLSINQLFGGAFTFSW